MALMTRQVNWLTLFLIAAACGEDVHQTRYSERAGTECDLSMSDAECESRACISKNAEFFELDAGGVCSGSGSGHQRVCVQRVEADRGETNVLTYYVKAGGAGSEGDKVMLLDSDVGELEGWAKCESDCGCSSEGVFEGETDAGCAPAPCPSTSEWDEGSCACVPMVMSPRCDLDTVLSERLQGSDAVDCGTLDIRETPERLKAAHDCVATALSERKPLRLIKMDQGVDSTVGGAYLVDASGSAYAFGYDGDPSGGSYIGSIVSGAHCAGLSAKPDSECTPTDENLCIVCESPSNSGLVCRGEPR
jgi:hypothetical protein